MQVPSTPSTGSPACKQATTHAWLRTLTSTPAPGKPSPSPSTVSDPKYPCLDSGGHLFNLPFYSFLKFPSEISYTFSFTLTQTQGGTDTYVNKGVRIQEWLIVDVHLEEVKDSSESWRLYSWCDCSVLWQVKKGQEAFYYFVITPQSPLHALNVHLFLTYCWVLTTPLIPFTNTATPFKIRLQIWLNCGRNDMQILMGDVFNRYQCSSPELSRSRLAVTHFVDK